MCPLVFLGLLAIKSRYFFRNADITCFFRTARGRLESLIGVTVA